MLSRRACAGRPLSAAADSVLRFAHSSVERLEFRRMLAADDLDSTFGMGGMVIDQLGPIDVMAGAVDPASGNVAVVGDAAGTAVVAQYDASGNFMWSFDISNNFDDAIDVAYDSQGRVAVAGDGAQDFIIARFNTTGTPDGTFDGDGFYQHIATGAQTARGVAVRPDNTILVVGIDSAGSDMAVLQVDSLGQPTGLGIANGYALIDVGSSSDEALGVALQSDGTAVIAGQTSSGTQDYALVLLEPNGTLTQTVIDDGVSELLSGVAVGLGDVIHAVGTANNVPFLLTFDAAGVRTNTTAIGSDLAGGIDTDGMGDVYVATSSINFDTYALTRFTPAGAVDTNFGTGGTVTAPVSGAFVLTFDVAVNADDKPVAFGISDADVVLARWGDDGGGNQVTAVMQGNNLVITGTTDADAVRVATAANGNLKVFSGDTVIATFAVSGEIVLNAGAGADDINIATDVPNDSQIHGGEGDDIIKGGGGKDLMFGDAGHDKLKAREAADILVGGTGSDTLAGGEGRDLLFGGADADKIAGQDESDIIVSGTTSHDADPAALFAIQTEWMRTNNTIAQRRTNIRDNGVGAGSYKLSPNNTVFDDNARDTLSGGTGSDWFLANTSGTGALDKITDLSSLDFIDDLAFILAP